MQLRQSSALETLALSGNGVEVLDDFVRAEHVPDSPLSSEFEHIVVTLSPLGLLHAMLGVTDDGRSEA